MKKTLVPSALALIIATSANAAIAPADPARNAIRVDATADLGMVCDGDFTNNDAIFNSWLAFNPSFVGTLVFSGPSLCQINPTSHVMPQGLSLAGENGGGLMFPSNSTITANVLAWNTTAANISIRDLAFNINGAGPSLIGSFGVITIAPPNSPTATFGPSNVAITRTNIFGAAPASIQTSRIDLLRLFGIAGLKVDHNSIAFTSKTSFPTKAINVGSYTPAGGSMIKTSDVDLSDNQLTNSGMYVTDLSGRLTVKNNRCNGWGFGACFAAEPHVGALLDLDFKGGVISGNVMMHSSNVPDSSNNVLYGGTGTGTPLRGLELGLGGLVVTGNISIDTCGQGIYVFGPGNAVTGNTIIASGSCGLSLVTESGIGIGSRVDGNDADQTYIADNTILDQPGYGIAANSGTLDVAIGANYVPGGLGPHYIADTMTGVTLTQASSDNRLINPCGTRNQRNGTIQIASGYGPDGLILQQTVGRMGLSSSGPAMNQCDGSAKILVNTSATPNPSDIGWVYQPVPYGKVADFGYQGTNPQSAVDALCLKTGLGTPWTTSLVTQNANANTTYARPITLSAGANLTQCFSVIVPGDPTFKLGSPSSPNSVALRVGLGVSSGTGQLLSTPGVWTVGRFYGLTTDQPFTAQPVGSYVYISSMRFYPARSDNGWAPKPNSVLLEEAQKFFYSSFEQGVVPAQGPVSLSVSALTSNGTTATATVVSTAAMTSGQQVAMAGAADAGYNGPVAVTVKNPTQFTYAVASGLPTPTSGTITATWLNVGAAVCDTARVANALPALTIPLPNMIVAPGTTSTVTTFNLAAADANWQSVSGGTEATVSIPAFATMGGMTSTSLSIGASGTNTIAAGDRDCLGVSIDTNFQ